MTQADDNIVDKYNHRELITLEIVKAASEDDLRELKCFVDRDIASIDTRLVKVHSAAAEGDYMDSVAYGRLVGAKKFKGVLSQWIQLEFSRRKRERAKEADNTVIRSMLKAMDTVLTSETKELVVETARQLRRSGGHL